MSCIDYRNPKISDALHRRIGKKLQARGDDAPLRALVLDVLEVISRPALAKRLGVTEATLRNYVSGKRHFSDAPRSMLRAISEVSNLSFVRVLLMAGVVNKSDFMFDETADTCGRGDPGLVGFVRY